MRKLGKFVLLLFLWAVIPTALLFWLSTHVIGSIPDASARVKLVRETILDDMAVHGISASDFDGDGDDDLYVAGCPAKGAPGLSRLMANDGRGIFSDVTMSIGLPSIGATSGYFVDYDGDGDNDLFVMEACGSQSRVRAFENRGSTFVEVTRRLGVGDSVSSQDGALAFADLDADGWLDMVAVHGGKSMALRDVELESLDLTLKDYLYGQDWVLAVDGADGIREVFKTNASLTPLLKDEYVQEFIERGSLRINRELPPGIIVPITNLLHKPRFQLILSTPGEVRIYRNAMGNRFEERAGLLPERRQDRSISTGRGVQGWDVAPYRFFMPTILDFNDDGLPDIFISSPGGRSTILYNRDNFVFDRGSKDFQTYGTWMGVGSADLERDGTPQVVVTNVGGAYVLERTETGLETLDDHSLNAYGTGWGIAFPDIENDGWPDLYISNGTFTIATTSRFYRAVRSPKLYLNANGFLHDVSRSIEPAIEFATRPAAVTDVDSDGRADIVIGGVRDDDTHGAYLLRNATENSNTFARIRLRDFSPNTAAIGAAITIESEPGRHTQYVSIGESFFSAHSPTKIFGLGPYKADTVMVRITWPDGTSQESEAAVGKTTVIVRE
jgi:enediyne biosynthesis protein E4